MAVENATFGLTKTFVNYVTFSHEGVEGCGYMILCIACVHFCDCNFEGKGVCRERGFRGDSFFVVSTIYNVGVEKDTIEGK